MYIVYIYLHIYAQDADAEFAVQRFELFACSRVWAERVQ